MAKSCCLGTIGVIACLLAGAGCDSPSSSTTAEPPAPPAANSVPPQPEASLPAAAPSEGAAVAPSAEDEKLVALEAKLKAAPDDGDLKHQTAQAAYEAGHAMMLNPDLPPRSKYRGALKLLRRALELEPKHTEAAADKKQIEDIYTSMGRPIPE